MANHKRGRPKQRRAGCLLCKPQKLPALKKGSADALAMKPSSTSFEQRSIPVDSYPVGCREPNYNPRSSLIRSCRTYSLP